MTLKKREYYLILLIFVLFISFHQILCEGEECDLETGENCNEEECQNCGDDFRFFYQDSKCHKCEDISSQGPFYTLVENECFIKNQKTEDNELLINGTYEIVNICKENYPIKLGDICYQNLPFLETELEEEEEGEEGQINYRCKYFFYRINKYEFSYYNCLGNCPTRYKYYDYETKECIDNCFSGEHYLKKETNGDTYIYRCSDECIGTVDKKEYIYENYCLDQCPQERKYYNTFTNEIYHTTCLQNCSSYISRGNECLDTDDCGGNFIKVDTSNNIYSCTEGQSCPSDYPYKYEKNDKNYCLKSCKDSTDDYFSTSSSQSETTYIFENSSGGEETTIVKTCVNRIEGDEPYYIDSQALKWVKDCKNSITGIFNNGTHCLKSCEGYFLYDELKCVTACDTEDVGGDNTDKYIYKDEENKICYKKCPSNSGKEFYNSTKQCQTCNVPQNENSIIKGKEGYHYKGEYLCKDSCEENEYHNGNDNICFSESCQDTQIYKYQQFGKKICYKSCLDIKDNYKIEYNYVCYNNINQIGNVENYYFYNNYGIIKYINKVDFKECIEANLKYLKGSECISNCDENEYKILPTSDKIGICFGTEKPNFPIQTNNANLDYSSYLFINNKIISNQCNYLKILDNNNNPITTFDENCVSICPQTYYEYEEEKKCQSSCELYILNENEGGNKCVAECNKFKMQKDSLKYCVNKCKKTTNDEYSFYDSDKNCFDSCNRSGKNDIYSLEPINDHQLCITNCSIYPSYPYYNEEEKICRSECKGSYPYYSKDIQTCIKQCGNNEYVHPGNICSEQPCPGNAPFYYVITYDNNEKVKYCVPNCGSYNNKEYKYYKINTGTDDTEEKECVERCEAPSNLIYESRCYNSCPEGLYENESQCFSNCVPNYYIRESNNLKCVPNCSEQAPNIYHTSSGECASFCPPGESFIGDDNECLNICKSPNDYYIKEDLDGHDNYKCLPNCNGKVSINGTKECLDSCGDLYEYNGKCYRNCLNIINAEFSTKDINGKKICSSECISNEPYFEKDKICRSDCMSLSYNKIINDSNIPSYKFCVSECNLNSDYKFLNIISDILYCKTTCENNKRYLKSDYKCRDKCPETNNYVLLNGNNPVECLSECPEGNEYARFDSTSGEYRCSPTECNSNEFYYLTDRRCLSGCNGDYRIIDNKNNNICTKTCEYYTNNTKIYSFDKDGEEKKCVFDCKTTTLPYTSREGKCVSSCPDTDYYDEEDKICRIKCPSGKKIDGQLCRNSCNDINKYEDENENCVNDCSTSETGYKYHKDGETKCLSDCSNLYIEDGVCKSSCSEDKFIDEKSCLSICPIYKRYFTDTNNTCLTDCPKDKPYYTKIGDGDDAKYKCKASCNTYVPNSDPNINAQRCFDDDCESPFEKYIKENNQKKCYNECPSTHNFIFNNECLIKCPEDKVYVPEIGNECQEWNICSTGIIKYNTKECVKECSKTDIIYEHNYNGGNIKFCVDNCEIADKISNKGLHTFKLTYDKKCVENCPGFSEAEGNECICKRLFYYNKTTGYKECLNPDFTLCETVPNFPILKMYENECTNYCDGVLSLSETECYNNSYTCGENEEIKTLTNGDKVCVCKYKYYTITENERNIKKCLSENENCPSSNSLLIKETKECVPECPSDNIQFGKTCILECPSDYTKVGSKCECSGTWYISDNSDLVCINGECPSNKNLYVTDTKECVSSCIGTGSEIYFNKTCVKEDNSEIEGRTKVSSSDDPYLKDISRQYFRCDNLWYYDQKGYDICSDKSSENSCEDINFKYKISATNQCVNKCPDNYYRFNDECLYECKDNLKEINGKYMCECIKLWKYEDEATKNKIVCLSTDVCDNEYLLIKSTNQCIKDDKCPSEYAQFDKTCYNKDECPKELNTKYDEITQKCICEYKWYFDTESETQHCLSENGECPADYQYYNYATKECTKTNTEISENNLYEFNYIFYSNCPENTIIDENNPNKCICDPLLGYWYSEQQEDGKDIYICAQEKCSELKPYNIYQQKECIAECPEENKYLYRGICYDKCPYLTEVGNNNECQLSSVDNDIELENLEKAMTENILELYKKSTSFDTNITTGSVGQKIVTKNATVEFYGVNKKNKGKKDNIKSDLSYIDISDCLEKIYKSNNMKEGADIIILKFDVNKIPNKYLINPVEYKFINSENGQELDASVCEHNSIRISYPVHDLISRYDKLTKNRRKLEYMKISLTSNNKESLREKLDKGKEIFDEYPAIDIFDINAKIYSDICMAVEVDGKDLVLEDRIDYFYPQLSLCENNCTYNRTDFINERVYCDCSYKTEFDFDREYSSSFEINSNQVKNAQNGNSNIAVLKCISNLKSSKSISKNYGFIYSIIVIFIEIVLFCVIAFYGIRALLNKIKSKTNKNIENEYITEENILKTSNIKKTDEDIKTSERNLGGPPKKKKNFDIEFIPQEYLFLFFNQGEKNSIKKIERDNVPFKTKYNTRILLEKKKGVNYDNVTPSGPFPPGQNVLVIVDNMDEDINDYLGGDDDSSEEEKRKKKKEIKEKKSKKKEDSLEINPKPKLYKKTDYSISDYDPSDENYSIYYLDEEDDSPHEKGFLESLKANQRFITRKYEIAAQNKNINFVELLCTEILDKIYITKILLFTKKFQIFSLQLSVYFLCHILLLVFITLFFDIKTIRKIWQKENYPGLGYYLGYGFAACLIVWIIYRIFLCLLTNNDKIKEILKIIHYNNKFNMKKEKIIHKKFENLEWKIKFKFGFYTLIQLILLTFSFIYLTVFSTVYIGTQTKALKEYGIALIEILIIKIIYAIALASMRYVSLTKHKKGLYNVVLFMSTYLV